MSVKLHGCLLSGILMQMASFISANIGNHRKVHWFFFRLMFSHNSMMK